MITRKIYQALESLTSLGDPVRRRIYEAVASEGGAVSRNEVAKLTGLPRPLVAYHLDRLVKNGLLITRFERQTGRTGPGAGRPSKLYFRPKAAVQVSLPARDHDLVARVLIDSHARLAGADTERVVADTARELGKDLVRQQARVLEDDDQILQHVLMERGYEPQSEGGRNIWLRNCIFDELAERQRDLVCGMNLSIFQGILEALPGSGLRAELRPGPGRCCVMLVPAEDADPSDEDRAGSPPKTSS